MPVVLAHHWLHVQGHDTAVAHDLAAMHHGMPGRQWRAEHHRRDRIGKTAGIVDAVQVQREEVGAAARLQCADIGAAQHVGAAAGGDLQHLARAHERRPVRPQAGEQHGLPHFHLQVGGVVAGRAIDAESEPHAGLPVFAQRRDARSETHVGTRTMAHPDAASREDADLIVVHMHRMRVPHVGADPVQALHIFDRAHPMTLARVALLVEGLAQMRMQPHALRAGQRRLLTHQMGRDRKGRAGCKHDLQHSAMRRVVIAADHPFAVGHDGFLVLDAVVRRQPTPRLSKRHAAAGGDEAQADFLRGADLVIHPAAIAKQIGMIEHGGAAGQGQLGHADQGRGACRLRRASRPDAVMRAQPVEQASILRRRHVARQHLVQMVMTIHQARQQDLPGEIEHQVGARGQRLVGADLLDDAVAREQAAAPDLAAAGVHRHHHLGIVGKQRAHGRILNCRDRCCTSRARPGAAHGDVVVARRCRSAARSRRGTAGPARMRHCGRSGRRPGR